MKKTIFLMAATAMSLFASAQKQAEGYTINAELEGIKSPYVFVYLKGAEDSVAVRNGKFSIKGTHVDKPSKMYLEDRAGKLHLAFYVENVPVRIKGDANTPEEIRITGGKIQEEVNVLRAEKQVLRKKERLLNNAYQKAKAAKDAAAIADLGSQMDQLAKELAEKDKAFIAKYPKNPLNLDLISDMSYAAEYSELNALFQSLDENLKTSEEGQEFAKKLAVLQKGSNGQKMIDFTQNDMEGKPLHFSSFKGKYVLVDFWASWCGPCRIENPNVLKAYQQFKDKGFTVLGISLDNNADKWKQAVTKDKLPWTQVSDLKGWENEVSAYYGVQGIPANYLVNPEGIIVAKNLRGQALIDKLKELLEG